ERPAEGAARVEQEVVEANGEAAAHRHDPDVVLVGDGRRVGVLVHDLVVPVPHASEDVGLEHTGEDVDPQVRLTAVGEQGRVAGQPERVDVLDAADVSQLRRNDEPAQEGEPEVPGAAHLREAGGGVLDEALGTTAGGGRDAHDGRGRVDLDLFDAAREDRFLGKRRRRHQ